MAIAWAQPRRALADVPRGERSLELVRWGGSCPADSRRPEVAPRLWVDLHRLDPPPSVESPDAARRVWMFT